jgi:hypothetical protein
MTMNKKYIVKLTEEERTGLQKLIATGKAAARKLLHARVLLKVDMSSQGSCWSVGEISEALEVSPATIQRVRQQFVEQGLTAWEAERKGQQVRVNWRFTTQDARIKLKHLYPVLEKGSNGGTSNAERIKTT